MGEYIRKTQDGPQVAKLGTCESWGYIRRDECFLLREKGFIYDGNWNYIDRNDRQGPIFRFPWPNEDCFIKNGPDSIIAEMNKRDMYYRRTFQIPQELAYEIDHRTYHFSPKSQFGGNGLFHGGNWMLPCPNSKESENIGQWSSGSCRYQIAILGERQNQNGWYTIFACPYCSNIFALEPDDIAKIELPDIIAERVLPFIAFEPKGGEQ